MYQVIKQSLIVLFIPSFSLGDEVCVEIDGPRRMLHARLHSAGHLLDSALANIGINDLIPSKVLTYCLLNLGMCICAFFFCRGIIFLMGHM